ncbi:protein obstructor-E-like [Phlebotomus argentipes]|uniref:protein obstructor-E-like n=1 Tax=Phlebotomus argentipes TaxID=94469 RepID=UPI002892CC72|nr:protein obstructor-E-like [Phlebotomus argentipes]
MERFLCALTLLLLIRGSLGKDPNEMCRNVPDRSFLKDFARCENYYVCVNGVAHHDKCPEPFFFNEATQACDHQRNVACTNCPDYETAMTNPESKTCDSFVRCLNGNRYFTKCPVGFMYDEVIGRCNLVSKAECFAATCTADMDPSTFVFVASKIDCQRYFICHQDNPTMRECGEGLMYNPLINGCDSERNVACTPDGPVANIGCPEVGLVFRPHPTNCRQAFFCFNGEPTLISCSDGMAWSTAENQCLSLDQTTCV